MLRRCLCVLVIVAEPCMHYFGIHTGLEVVAQLAMTHLANNEP